MPAREPPHPLSSAPTAQRMPAQRLHLEMGA